MRTHDFSRAPTLARAEALVVTDRVRTARGAAGLVRQRRFAERAAGAGADGRTVRRRGVLAFFATPADAERFVAGLPHADGSADGFAHVYAAEAEGYSNGVWRAEDRDMAPVERFTALSGERARGVQPPLVQPPLVAGEHPARRPATPVRAARAPRPPRANPGLADARSMFVGATRYTGPHAWLALGRTWTPMVAKMRRLRGFRWYAVYYDPPFTLGTLAFFSGRDELLAFARMPEHRDLMLWITNGTRWGTGGYIRLHQRDGAEA